VLDALAIERAVLAGHSGSCLVARRVALDRPERVAGLVLEASPTWLGGDPARREFVGTSIMTLEDPIDPGFARSFVTDTSSGNVAPDLLEDLVADVVRVPARAWREMFASLLDYDDRAELTDVGAPALLIWGDRDAVVPRAMQEELVDLLPTATLTVYPGTGHTPRWEEPRRFADDVATFVARTAR
jgi:pimeloyl-ACP methyl ester carboxylesterase